MIPGYVFQNPIRVGFWKDGDTFQGVLDGGRRNMVDWHDVRIYQFHARELKESGGPEALLYAAWLVPPGTVVVAFSKPLGASGRWGGAQETLGRTLYSIRLPNGADFATLMILAGHGSAFPPPVAVDKESTHG